MPVTVYVPFAAVVTGAIAPTVTDTPATAPPADDLTVPVRVPGFGVSVAFWVVVAFGAIATPLAVTVPKCVLAKTTEYVPGAMPVTVYVPFAAVVTGAIAPTVTDTPATAPPADDVTVPDSVPGFGVSATFWVVVASDAIATPLAVTVPKWVL